MKTAATLIIAVSSLILSSIASAELQNSHGQAMSAQLAGSSASQAAADSLPTVTNSSIALSATCGGVTGGPRCVVEEQIGFDAQTFADELGFRLHNRFAEFGAVLMDRDGTMTVKMSQGLATKSGHPEGATPFKSYNWGSVSKIIATATVLSSIEDRLGNNMTVDDWLTRPLTDFLPVTWSNAITLPGAGARYQPVTLKMLLQHRTGLPKDRGGRSLFDILSNPLTSYPAVSMRSALTRPVTAYRLSARRTPILRRLTLELMQPAMRQTDS